MGVCVYASVFVYPSIHLLLLNRWGNFSKIWHLSSDLNYFKSLKFCWSKPFKREKYFITFAAAWRRMTSTLGRQRRIYIGGCCKCSNHRRSFNHSTSFIVHQRIQPQCRNPQETTLCYFCCSQKSSSGLFVCLFVFCCCWLFMWWRSHGPRHLKLGLYCYRKLWERSWKYPLLGNGRPLKPRPGCALLSGVLKMCWNQAWEIRAGRLSQEDLGGQCGRQHPSPSIAFRHSLGAAVL